VKLHCSVTASPDAKKKYTVRPSLRSSFKNAAALVARNEFPELHSLELSIVLLCDEELLAMNRSTLGHDWLTDILTFEIERTADELEVELYISADRAKENAQTYRATVALELVHLVVHGLLHVAGFGDKTAAEKKRMRARERWYLAQLRPDV